MRWRQFKRLRESALPLLYVLIGQSIHQVDADIFEACVGSLTIGVHGIGCVVTASESLQQVVVKALYADAQAVDAAVQICGKLVGGEIAGVCLQRYLGARRKIESSSDCFHSMPYVLGGQVRWSAAAKENRMHFRSVKQTAPQGDFRLQSRDIRWHERLNGRVCVEVAVRAFRLAERYMNIKGYRLGR